MRYYNHSFPCFIVSSFSFQFSSSSLIPCRRFSPFPSPYSCSSSSFLITPFCKLSFSYHKHHRHNTFQITTNSTVETCRKCRSSSHILRSSRRCFMACEKDGSGAAAGGVAIKGENGHKSKQALVESVQESGLDWKIEIRVNKLLDMHLFSGILADHAEKSDALMLYGDLGVGKTAFAQGYLRKFTGDPCLAVTSPTYTLINVYPSHEFPQGRLTIYDPNTGKVDGIDAYHMDLWRLESTQERGLVEDWNSVWSNNVCLVEWPQRLSRDVVPQARLEVVIEIKQGNDEPKEEQQQQEDKDDSMGEDDENDDDHDIDSFRLVQLSSHGGLWEQGRKSSLFKTLQGIEKFKMRLVFDKD